MLPTREEAIGLLCDGLSCNPGHWEKHCLTAAHCAEKIASVCGDMDSDKAFIPGLLHDIGRKFGVRHLGHVSDGYTYMKLLGYDEYDWLIQLCDSLARADGVLDIEEKMNIYLVCEKDTFVPEEI